MHKIRHNRFEILEIAFLLELPEHCILAWMGSHDVIGPLIGSLALRFWHWEQNIVRSGLLKWMDQVDG